MKKKLCIISLASILILLGFLSCKHTSPSTEDLDVLSIEMLKNRKVDSVKTTSYQLDQNGQWRELNNHLEHYEYDYLHRIISKKITDYYNGEVTYERITTYKYEGLVCTSTEVGSNRITKITYIDDTYTKPIRSEDSYGITLFEYDKYKRLIDSQTFVENVLKTHVTRSYEGRKCTVRAEGYNNGALEWANDNICTYADDSCNYILSETVKCDWSLPIKYLNTKVENKYDRYMRLISSYYHSLSHDNYEYSESEKYTYVGLKCYVEIEFSNKERRETKEYTYIDLK